MDIETVPLAAYESLSTRLTRIIKYLIMGWALSMIAMGLVLVISFSYSEEVMTETITNEVEQEADESGSNTFTGGDYYGGQTDSQTDGNEDDGQEVEGSSVAQTE